MKQLWPYGKKFAFSIVDDTDGATLENIKPVYDYLKSKNIITTKTIWSYPSRDKFRGDSIESPRYREFILDLKRNGYEIAFHGAGSGVFQRDETIYALNNFKETFGDFPRIHTNHASNIDSLYWGRERFSPWIIPLYMRFKSRLHQKTNFLGNEKNSSFFWGDVAKERISYIRNMVFPGINTLFYDRHFPYMEKYKEKYSNYWFSSSYGIDLSSFVTLLSEKNINKLEKESGCSIVYTHFAYGFVNELGELDARFKQCIDFLAEKNGWFVPTSEILDYLKTQKGRGGFLSPFAALIMNIRWLFGRGFQEKSYRKLISK